MRFNFFACLTSLSAMLSTDDCEAYALQKHLYAQCEFSSSVSTKETDGEARVLRHADYIFGADRTENRRCEMGEGVYRKGEGWQRSSVIF